MKLSKPSKSFLLSTGILTGTLVAATLVSSPNHKLAGVPTAQAATAAALPITTSFADPTGFYLTISSNGDNVPSNEFFHPLGTNGRACVTCHQPDEAWSITPGAIQAKFNATSGMDPLFRTVDGSVSPNFPVCTVQQRREAYSMLLNKGLIRVSLPVLGSAQFSLANVYDPYNYADADHLSLFRRPLPATNLRFLTAVMWDGRAVGGNGSVTDDLEAQAINAIATHEQGAVQPSSADLAQMLGLETNLYTAQNFDKAAGCLNAGGAAGGPVALLDDDFYAGINDVAGGDPTGKAFNSNVFTMYSTWSTTANKNPVLAAEASVARGERIFDDRQFEITGVVLTTLSGYPQFPVLAAVAMTTQRLETIRCRSFSILGRLMLRVRRLISQSIRSETRQPAP